MVYLLYGEDEFSLREFLASLKQEVDPAELRDVNVTTLDGAEVGFDELAATCDTVPFLSQKRMVVVERLLAQFERRGASRRSNRVASSTEPALGVWEALPNYLGTVPPTTELVFVEQRLTDSNPLFAKVRPVVTVRTFPLPGAGGLREWVRKRAEFRGVDIDPRAVDALAETIGRDLRVIDTELQKLSLYRWGQTVREEDVKELVSYAKEANIFAAVDAALEGRTGVGIRLIHQILYSGNPPSYVIAMIARQVRLLLLAKELRAQGIAPAEIGRRLSLSSYPLRKTLEQERKFTTQQLVEFHHKLLEADLSMKTSASDDQLALDMLIADLASTR